MLTTSVINIKKLTAEQVAALNRKEWLEEGQYVYCGRPGRGFTGYFGNPIEMKNWSDEERSRVLKEFEYWFIDRMYQDGTYNRRIVALKGKTLVCFCHPKACHCMVIAGWIDPEATW